MGEVQTEPVTLRHLKEKERLLGRLAKSHGSYDINHPRFRLLKALWGFSKYREFSRSEVKRWRDMYKHVSNQQKAVSIAYSSCGKVVTDSI